MMHERTLGALPGIGGGRNETTAMLLAWLSEAVGERQADRASGASRADAADARLSLDGDQEAYRRLVERHQAAVGRLLWRFTRDRSEHEELTQQVFVEAFLSLATYGGKAPFAHWLARIATRVGYRYWKETRRRPAASLSQDMWNDIAAPRADGTDSRQAGELAHRLLAELPVRDRLVLTLRYLEQLDVAETARRIGWTRTLVRVQTHRAIAKLKKLAREARIELELS